MIASAISCLALIAKWHQLQCVHFMSQNYCLLGQISFWIWHIKPYNVVTKTFDTYTGHNINDTIKTMWTMNQSCNEHGQLTNKEIILKIMGSVNGQYSANNRDTVFGIPIKTALDFPNQWWWSAHYFCYINCASIYGLIRIFSTYTEIIYKDYQIHLRTRPREWNYTQKWPDIIQKINLKSHEEC